MNKRPFRLFVTFALFISYVVNPKIQETKLYWKDDKQINFKSVNNLKPWLDIKNKKIDGITTDIK